MGQIAVDKRESRLWEASVLGPVMQLVTIKSDSAPYSALWLILLRLSSEMLRATGMDC